MNTKVYYQPDLTRAQWEAGIIPSFGVFRLKMNAKKQFPSNRIIRYTGKQIENPTYLD